LADIHLVTFGGEWRKEHLEDGGFVTGDAQNIHRALFLQDEIQFDPSWSLVLGNRFDQHEQYGWHNSPRAYLVHHVNDALTIKGGGGRARAVAVEASRRRRSNSFHRATRPSVAAACSPSTATPTSSPKPTPLTRSARTIRQTAGR